MQPNLERGIQTQLLKRPLFLLPVAAMLASVVVVSACPGTTGDDGGTTTPESPWSEAFPSGDVGSLSSVWGSGPGDVWVVGGDANSAEIHHYDGTAWTKEQNIPAVELLVWVYGFGPNDVYAVGVGGGMVHYDGNDWTAIDSGTTEDLWGVFGLTNNDIWIVGGDVAENDPIILHYDGNGPVTPHTVAAEENPNGALSLFKVWGIGTKVFAVGQKGLILTWDGANWVREPAGAEADDDFVSLWGTSEDNIVAVGGRSNARIAHYDGSSWTTTAPSGVGGLNAVFMSDAGKAWVGGVWGSIALYDLASEDLEYDDVDSRMDIHAMWGAGGKAYAVGGTFLAPHQGVALVRDVP